MRGSIDPVRPCQYRPPTAIDAGTLGHAGLLRLRATAGVLFRGVEAYTGYEYLDIGRANPNGLVAGLRLWF